MIFLEDLSVRGVAGINVAVSFSFDVEGVIDVNYLPLQLNERSALQLLLIFFPKLKKDQVVIHHLGQLDKRAILMLLLQLC